MNAASHKTSRYWSKYETVRNTAGFYTSPVVRPSIIEMAYGKQAVSEYAENPYFAEDLFVNTYLRHRTVGSILSLCCGFGSVERRIVSQLGTVDRCLGLDIAAGALAAARKAASDEGLTCVSYEQMDLSQYQWTPNNWDVVVANGALHHMAHLERVLDGVRQTLKPGGIFYACEYVGPSYQDHSPRQLELINACAYLVPPELRARRGLPLMNKRMFRLLSTLCAVAERQPRVEWVWWKKLAAAVLRHTLARDRHSFGFGAVYISPQGTSACHRSVGVYTFRRDYTADEALLPSVEIRPFGGGILQHALDNNFYDRFDGNNATHARTLQLLRELEAAFVESGEIGIENAFLIATKDSASG